MKKDLLELWENDKGAFFALMFMGLILLGAFLISGWNNIPLGTTNEAEGIFADENKPLLSRKKYIEVGEFVGFSLKELEYMYNVCSTSKNPNNCFSLSLGIAHHETKGGKAGVGRTHRNNLYGIMQYAYGKQIPKVYTNRMASFEDWNSKYNTYWYNNDCNAMITKSHYTTTDIMPWLESCVKIEGMLYD